MKKAKKITALLLAAVMAAAIFINVAGRDYEAENGEPYGSLPSFGSVTGKVETVTDDNGSGYRIRIAVGEGFADFNVRESTFILGEVPKVGDRVTGFYETSRPMITIYPPQYTPLVIVNNDEDLPFVFVDRFHVAYDDGEMQSADGLRRLNVKNPETEIVSQGGQDAADWDLEGRLLVVIYDATSRSIPPLIFAPEKIIVMYEIAVHPGPEPIEWDNGLGVVPPVGNLDITTDREFHDIVVNGVGLPGISYYSAGDAMFPTHVPLRAMAEFIEPQMQLGWSRGTATLKGAWGDISFVAGSAAITVDGRTVTLNQPTVINNGRVYVPLSFFREVVGMNNAYSIGGTVFIDNFERME
jgi:hypothetical protein